MFLGDSDMSSEDSVSSDSSDSEDESKSTAPGTPKSTKAATPSRRKRTEVEDQGVVSICLLCKII